MKIFKKLSTLGVVLPLVTAAVSVFGQTTQEPGPFLAPRNEPPIVTPGRTASEPPSDALVLFDGKELSHWRTKEGNEVKWQVRDGYLEVLPKTGDIVTREEFGDCQLHIEWATPSVVAGEGQGRGNSGVFLMQRYEVQLLDSYQNKTYYHGQAGAIYKQYAPLVNASRQPGQGSRCNPLS